MHTQKKVRIQSELKVFPAVILLQIIYDNIFSFSCYQRNNYHVSIETIRPTTDKI